MGGFEVAFATNPRPLVWCPVSSVAGSYDTIYEGQLLQWNDIVGLDGVRPLGAAAGIADTTTEGHVPFGIAVGQNAMSPSYSSTYKGFSITSALPHASTVEYAGVEGPYAKGDKQAMVLVELINPSSIIKGRIFNATYGTAITVGTVTTGHASGTGFTCSAGLSDASTPVAALGTVYCRSGANMGIYRMTTDTSATVKTVTPATPFDIAVGDKFVNVQLKSGGTCYMQTDAESMFVNAAANPATDYWIIEVVKLDLSEPGNEYVLFRFNTDHFCRVRA
jgi:hypothetical protein